MSKAAMKVIEGEIAENGEPKIKRKAEIAIAAQPTADAWLQTMKELAPVVGIEGLRELMTMRREEQGRLAEREFNTAMALAQAELEPVTRNQKNKQTGNSYADLAAIAEAAMPVIHAHGFFAVTSEFQSQKPDHLGVALDVGHRGGHSRRYEFNIPWDGAGLKGNANKTPTHAYASTLAYGERYAKCKVFGISTKDDDGNAAGKVGDEPVTDVQAGLIKSLIVETDADLGRFLNYFGIGNVEDMPAKRYQEAERLLKARKGKPT